MARDVHDTARKLRRLMASPNPHEAARAKERFDAFVRQHRLAVEDLEDEPANPFTTVADAVQSFSDFAVTILRRGEVARRAAEAEQARAEQYHLEYLRHLPTAKREAQLQQLPKAERGRLRQRLAELQQAAEARRRGRRKKTGEPA
jgi:hypothetical protein